MLIWGCFAPGRSTQAMMHLLEGHVQHTLMKRQKDKESCTERDSNAHPHGHKACALPLCNIYCKLKKSSSEEKRTFIHRKHSPATEHKNVSMNPSAESETQKSSTQELSNVQMQRWELFKRVKHPKLGKMTISENTEMNFRTVRFQDRNKLLHTKGGWNSSPWWLSTTAARSPRNHEVLGSVREFEQKRKKSR